MSPEAVFQRWLSLRSWLLRTVLPTALALMGVLALLSLIGPDAQTLDHTAVMAGFAAVYFTLFRGGHLMMIRSLHKEMMRKHQDAYREKLFALSSSELKRSNLGFTLARLKRDILMEERDRKKRPFGD